MTSPASTDARDLVSASTPKLPHERDESTDDGPVPDTPEIQQAFEATTKGQQDTSKGEKTDGTYNSGVVAPQERESGTAAGRGKPDPAAQK